MKNYYALLNMTPDSSVKEIRAAYRKLAKAHHPDKGGDPGRFCDILEAYDTLSDPNLRADYDRRLSRLPFTGAHYRTVSPVVAKDTVDIFDDLVDVISRKFGFEYREAYDADIILSPQEADAGANLEIRVPREQICDMCFGFGGSLLADCGKCNGSGSILGIGKIYLRITPGSKRGDTIIAQTGDFLIRARIGIEG
jgi:DnaJ-class molecular chaperone